MTTATLNKGFRHPIICPTLPNPEELMEAMRGAFRSGRVTVGEQVAAFEEEVAAKVGARNVIGVAVGKHRHKAVPQKRV